MHYSHNRGVGSPHDGFKYQLDLPCHHTEPWVELYICDRALEQNEKKLIETAEKILRPGVLQWAPPHFCHPRFSRGVTSRLCFLTPQTASPGWNWLQLAGPVIWELFFTFLHGQWEPCCFGNQLEWTLASPHMHQWPWKDIIRQYTGHYDYEAPDYRPVRCEHHHLSVQAELYSCPIASSLDGIFESWEGALNSD